MMFTIPKIIKDNSPSCCYLNDRRNMMCVVKDLYDLMNINYDFLSDGGLELVIKEYMKEHVPEDWSLDPATTTLIDSLFI